MSAKIAESKDLEQTIEMPVILRWTRQKVTLEVGACLVPVTPNSEDIRSNISISNIETHTSTNGPIVTFDVEIDDEGN